MKKVLLNILVLSFFLIELKISGYADKYAELPKKPHNPTALEIEGYTGTDEIGIELLLTYYKGNRVGYDKVTKKIFTEFDNSGYDETRGVSDFAYKELGIWNPLPGVYTLTIFGIENEIYEVRICAYNEDPDDVEGTKFYFSGIIAPEEEQNIEIIYQHYTFETSTASKTVDINLLKKETKTAFKYKMIKNNSLKKPLFKYLTQAEKGMKLGKNDIVKDNIKLFIEELNKEKLRLMNAGFKEPEIQFAMRKASPIFSLNILMTDAKYFLESIK